MSKTNKISIITLILCSHSFIVLADKVYSCKDTSGKIIFQDSPCADNEKQISSKSINHEKSSGATINRAICKKSIKNIHKYLAPKMISLLSAKEREKLVQENIAQCMKGHTEKDYQEILCIGRAYSHETVALCMKPPS